MCVCVCVCVWVWVCWCGCVSVYWRDAVYYKIAHITLLYKVMTCTFIILLYCDNVLSTYTCMCIHVHVHMYIYISSICMSCCIILSVFPHQSEAKSLTDAQSSVLSITEDEQGSHRPSGLKSPYRKIVAENERLRKELKKV